MHPRSLPSKWGGGGGSNLRVYSTEVPAKDYEEELGSFGGFVGWGQVGGWRWSPVWCGSMSRTLQH